MTYNKQILIPPLIITIIFVLIYLFSYIELSDIRKENIKIRQWANLTESLERSTVIAKNMQIIALKLAKGDDPDELYFQYLDNSNSLTTVLDRVRRHKKHIVSYIATRLSRLEARVSYQKKLDLKKVDEAFTQLIPYLNTLYRDAHAKKRNTYIHYYNKVNSTTAQAINYSVFGLIISVLFCIALIVWSCNKSRNPLNKIAELNRRIADLLDIPRPANNSQVLCSLEQTLEQTLSRLAYNSSPRVIIDSTEQERSRIARDMHDQALSDLTNLSREIEKIDSNSKQNISVDPGELKNKLLNEITAIKEGIRKIIDDLHPQELDLIGLGAAIQSHLEKYCSSKTLPLWKTHIDPEACNALDKNKQLHMYRICLEALNNTLKHARCSRYEINLLKAGTTITLIVEDNGIGFNPEQLENSLGHGLPNIRERALLINGEAKWSPSRFSTGCRFELTIHV